ncbi:MotY family protein [Candidatus Endoriftia persephonae]|jgi:outer membrane protein OmpA-like peptidoglycan-associated protein|uniref:Sodium-type flagellar protein MotY n=2 Tax=Gammaproteobacteria TaxID=1236 RepID=G2FC04_9GAMM|nr:OmpA family protein [Candidatus Endoriftia persephone]EGW55835.1 sodium-type flagellar protein MotY [endosymbiont of Tevnia jerichonana (vent Tica)]USF86195.1 OmpA family protein [Candidatus Endoriftia persephone]
MQQRLNSLYRLFLLILLVAVVSRPHAAPVDDVIYMAEVNYAEWAFVSSQISCELKHEIPGFGVARFLQIAGEKFHFLIDSYQPVPRKGSAEMWEISPSWEPGTPDPLVQTLQIEPGLRPVLLQRQPASWLLASLAKGQIGSIGFTDWDDKRKQVQLRLSPVNFQRPYLEFRKCLKALPEKGFADYRYSEVRFALNLHDLDASAKALLKELADYLNRDERVKSVRIEGHADDQGRRKYNLKLSERRAMAVKAYLVEQGVEQARLATFHYGESRPKVRSRSQKARAKNRRVAILLSK